MKWAVTWLMLVTSVSADAVEIDCFGANNGAAAYIQVDFSTLLAKPGERTSNTTGVSFGERVCVLTTSVLNEQNWAFVRAYSRDKNNLPVQGWLPEQSFVHRKKMPRLYNVRAQTVEVINGDYFAEYVVKSGGAFEVVLAVSEHKCRKNEVANEFGACEDLATVKGYLYGSRQLAISRSKTYGEIDTFKRREDGTLCPWQYGDIPEKCR